MTHPTKQLCNCLDNECHENLPAGWQCRKVASPGATFPGEDSVGLGAESSRPRGLLTSNEKTDPREWLIRKRGYYYRPNRAGYTASVDEAGRYTETEAKTEAAIEPWHMAAVHQSAVEPIHSFKNFHRQLCERFGYAHDEVDWQRDQVSLIEHIAKRLSGDGSQVGTPKPSKNRSLDQRLRSKVGGFLLEPDTADGGDTLAIALCSYFEKHMHRPKDDPESENGWGQWAEDKTNAALDALTRALSGDSPSAPSEIERLREELFNARLELARTAQEALRTIGSAVETSCELERLRELQEKALALDDAVAEFGIDKPQYIAEVYQAFHAGS